MKKTGTILDKILAKKAEQVAAAKSIHSLSRLQSSLNERQTPVRDFSAALGKKAHLNIMAEIKKASPSAGLIRTDFDHLQIARAYEHTHLVDAISVLTEEDFFQGKLSFIKEIKQVTSMPIFRKDFIFDEYQIYESYLAEADALLLIVAALSHSDLKMLIRKTHELGMECLIETHSAEEIEIALAAGGKIIGINTRDLKTFVLDKTLFSRLVHLLPSEIIRVAESGLENKNEIQKIYQDGANAALIGTSIMKAENIEGKIADLLSLL